MSSWLVVELLKLEEHGVYSERTLEHPQSCHLSHARSIFLYMDPKREFLTSLKPIESSQFTGPKPRKEQ